MIHQLIFAYPKPGLSEEEFHRYWLEEHAVRYASRIPQIKQYAVDTRVPVDTGAEPLWLGIAEIWLANEEEQLASLQTEEFLQGARLDEPRWAAFWRTLVMDTDTRMVLPGAPPAADERAVKLFILLKRKEGMSLEEFRRRSLEEQAPLAVRVPGLRRYAQGITRDGAYAVGEAPLDAAHQFWFDDVEALREALASPEYRKARADLEALAEPKYVHTLAVRQHWIIPPDARAAGDPSQ
jgi:uncharacterized protein (TIGR02118 family)